MTGLILRRIASAIPTLLIVITLAFFLMRAAPGGPFNLARPLDPAVMANLQKLYRLDEPLWRQYLAYLTGLAHGDLGPSFFWRDFTVAQLFAKALPISAMLGAAAISAALILGGLAGALAAASRGGPLDLALTTLASLGLTVPNFVVAPLLQLVLGLWLRWLPVGGWGEGDWRHLLLPVFTLALPQIAAVARLTRAAMIEALAAPPSRTLRAYGLSSALILRHAFRAALMPVLSYLGPAAAALMTGSIVVESIFGIPGVGRYFVDGALNRDYPLVMGAVVVVACLIVALNLVVDIAYAFVDPRVRHE